MNQPAAGLSTRERRAQIAAVVGANVVVGMTVAATAVGEGMSAPLSAVLTAGMFAGAAQFAAMSAMSATSASGGLLAGWVAAMLVNARFLLLGASIAPRLTVGRGRRVALAGFLVDPIVVLAQREDDDVRATRTYVMGGSLTLLGWVFGSLVGAFGVGRFDDLEAVGLDVALPALLLAIVAGGARVWEQRVAAGTGAAIAVALLSFGLPPGVVVLCSALGVLVPLGIGARRRSDGGTDRQGNTGA